MSLEWCNYWISLFADKPDELIGLYSPEFLFEDINMGIRIENDLDAMKQFQANFVNSQPQNSYNSFEVWDWVGTERIGSFQWTWKALHEKDFLGVPAAGKKTSIRGLTVMAWNADGKITLERSIWDAWAPLEQLDAIKKEA